MVWVWQSVSGNSRAEFTNLTANSCCVRVLVRVLYIISSIISSHIISYHLITSHLILYHLTSSHLISYHLISYHLIISHLISSHHISHPSAVAKWLSLLGHPCLIWTSSPPSRRSSRRPWRMRPLRSGWYTWPPVRPKVTQLHSVDSQLVIKTEIELISLSLKLDVLLFCILTWGYLQYVLPICREECLHRHWIWKKWNPRIVISKRNIIFQTPSLGFIWKWWIPLKMAGFQNDDQPSNLETFP